LACLYAVDGALAELAVSVLAAPHIYITPESTEKAISTIQKMLTMITDNVITGLNQTFVSRSLAKISKRALLTHTPHANQLYYTRPYTPPIVQKRGKKIG